MKTERTLPDSLARWTRARRLPRAPRGRQTALDTRLDPWAEVLLQENQAIPPVFRALRIPPNGSPTGGSPYG
jgi:hypothetical protein